VSLGSVAAHGHRSDRFYHAVAFTPVELLSAPIEQVEQALRKSQVIDVNAAGLRDNIDRDDDQNFGSPRYRFSVGQLLLILCRDFGVPALLIDLKLSHQASLKQLVLPCHRNSQLFWETCAKKNDFNSQRRLRFLSSLKSAIYLVVIE